MGFLIPSLEQYRYIRRYKRQRRLEREQREAAVAAATSQNDTDHNAITGNENDALPCTVNPSCSENCQQQPLPSSHTKRHDRKRRRTQNDDNDDFSVGSDSAAASHISDLLGGSQSDAMDDAINAVEVVAKENSDHGTGHKDLKQRDIQFRKIVAAGKQERGSLDTAQNPHDIDMDVSQPQQKNTQSSSATELPPVNERIKLSHKSILPKPRAQSEHPSNMAATAAAAAANYVAAKTQEPAPQEMKAPPPAAATFLERHPSRTTSYATSGMTLSVREQEPARAPSRQNSGNYDDDATEFCSNDVPLPSSFVITSPVHQPESQGTVSPIQSPIEAIERYQREQYKEQQRQLQQQKQKAPAAMKQKQFTFPKKRSSHSSSGSSKPWFQKRKRRRKLSQTTLSFRSNSK